MDALPKEASKFVFTGNDVAVDVAEHKNLKPTGSFSVENPEKNEVKKKENTQQRKYVTDGLEKLAEQLGHNPKRQCESVVYVMHDTFSLRSV